MRRSARLVERSGQDQTSHSEKRQRVEKKEKEEEETKKKLKTEEKKRCHWANKCERTRVYHDEHWGRQVRDKDVLFEMLSLCSQQAGVSWNVVWNKRECYRQSFHGWDVSKVAAMEESDIDRLCSTESGVMRNRKKLLAIVNNARICQELEKSHPGGIVGYLWSFTGNEPIVNRVEWNASRTPSTESATSKAMAKAMKVKGFKFLGSITLHAFCQQMGILNDHCASCFLNPSSTS